MDARELHWLAGLLEGEGSFLKPPPCDPNRPRITLKMTDEDVVQHVTKIFGMTYYTTTSHAGQEHRKTDYKITLRGRPAVAMMKQLRPLMGLRRQRAIAKRLLVIPQSRTCLIVHRSRSILSARPGARRSKARVYFSLGTKMSSSGLLVCSKVKALSLRHLVNRTSPVFRS